jgi:hypothetical protein
MAMAGDLICAIAGVNAPHAGQLNPVLTMNFKPALTIKINLALTIKISCPFTINVPSSFAFIAESATRAG